MDGAPAWLPLGPTTAGARGTEAAAGAAAGAGPQDRRSNVCSPLGRHRLLEGGWASRADGELRGRVEGGAFTWEEDGTSTPLVVHGDRGDVVSMTVDGVGHSGVLSEDGRFLRWGDGDVWVRVLPESALERSIRGCSEANLWLEESLPWAGWSRSRPCSSSVRSCSRGALAAGSHRMGYGAFV